MNRWRYAFDQLKTLSYGLSVYRGLAPLVVMSIALTNVYGLSKEWVIGMALVLILAGGLFALSLRFSNINIPAFEANEDMSKVLWVLYGIYVILVTLVGSGIWLLIL